MALFHLMIGFFRGDDVPWMSRPNYRREMVHVLLWGLFANLVTGTFSTIVVAKTFHASAILMPIVWATPLLADVLSFFWGVLIRGRRRVRTFTWMAVAAAVSVASIGLTPSDWHPWGGWVFALQLGVGRMFMSGLVTLRSSLWAANYPVTHRARIAGRIQTINILQLLVVTAGVSKLFDAYPESYRFVYPAIALVGVASLIPLRRIRVRGERVELRRRRRAAQAANAGRADGFAAGLRASWRDAVAILRGDRAFARYCTAQYCLGTANFLIDPLLVLIVTTELHFSYFQASFLLEQLPTILMLLSIRAWAHLFDRVGVLRFRVHNTHFWLASTVFAALGVLVFATGGAVAPRAAAGAIDAATAAVGAAATGGSANQVAFGGAVLAAVVLLGVSRALNGAARGGGAIAWNLGHLHFAPAGQQDLYMGIHQALTGVRGLLTPALGALLYPWLGWTTFLLSTLTASVALRMFRKMADEQDAARR
ncbi:MAG: hypothetical protein AB7Q17_02920 [Phycisphaerae bacterium]